MGVTQPAISALEKGKSDPNLGVIRRYANALGYIVSYSLIRESNEQAPSMAAREDVKPAR